MNYLLLGVSGNATYGLGFVSAVVDIVFVNYKTIGNGVIT